MIIRTFCWEERDYDIIGREAGNHTVLGTIGEEIVSRIDDEVTGRTIYVSHDSNWENYYVEDASILEHLDK